MKKYLIIAAVAISASACNQKELADAQVKNDSLESVVIQRDMTLDEFITSFNEVEQNLDSVASKQQIIAINSVTDGELKPSQKARINAEIEAINNLMTNNRNKIAELDKKYKSSANKNAAMLKSITTMTKQLEQKESELVMLNEKLNNLNAQVVQLQTSVSNLIDDGNTKSQIIAANTSALHTAYYVVGKSNALREAKVIDRTGGLLGIGKTSELSDEIDNNNFTRIDYTQTTSIPVNSKNVKLITSHPASSYTLQKDAIDEKFCINLVITNPEKFWSASKYLVLVTN
ncbi:MAG: hypothetical protein IPP29_14170 [Bacteroidetes bacterium]|nr:hypothetical protein [Bacteroidota bacterium]